MTRRVNRDDFFKTKVPNQLWVDKRSNESTTSSINMDDSVNVSLNQEVLLHQHVCRHEEKCSDTLIALASSYSPVYVVPAP